MKDEMGGKCNTHREDDKCRAGFYSENLKGGDHFEDLNENRKMILKVKLK
jgi:hypothetical protein